MRVWVVCNESKNELMWNGWMRLELEVDDVEWIEWML